MSKSKPSKLTEEIARAGADGREITGYRVLAILQICKDDFAANRLGSHLSQLAGIFRQLNEAATEESEIKQSLKKKGKAKELHDSDEALEYEKLTDEELRPGVQDVFSLIQDILPEIEETIHAGGRLFKKAVENTEIEWVSAVSRYLNEGYLIISAPDKEGKADDDGEVEHELHAYSYDLSPVLLPEGSGILEVDKESVQPGIRDPLKLKSELLTRHSDRDDSFARNPNPATILVKTSLAYPFDETILPVAKWRFLNWLNQQNAA